MLRCLTMFGVTYLEQLQETGLGSDGKKDECNNQGCILWVLSFWIHHQIRNNKINRTSVPKECSPYREQNATQLFPKQAEICPAPKEHDYHLFRVFISLFIVSRNAPRICSVERAQFIFHVWVQPSTAPRKGLWTC